MGLFDSFIGKIRRDSTVTQGSDFDATTWLSSRKESPVFAGLSHDALTEMCSRMEAVQVKEGTVLIKEGDEGDFFYILAKGTVRVTRDATQAQAANVLADLKEGASFGEEALISNARRNATVTVTAAGLVLRLSKADFTQFMKEPRLTWYSPVEAYKAVEKGAKWLDVRPSTEFRKGSLPNAINIPVLELRENLSKLDKKITCVCYCQTGRLSASAAYLLTEFGYKVAVLRGGLRHLPNLST